MKFFKKNNNVLKIKYENEHLWMPPIATTKSVTPEWYKNILPADSNIKSLPAALNIKSCVPFLDTLISGYIMPLPMDIAVKIDENGYPLITWSGKDFPIINTRDGSEAPGLPTPQGYHTMHFIWSTMSAFKLPKGYSALITHPLNRYDLPFITLSGIVDADSIMHQGNIPFYIKDGFEGLIKAGTPMFQIIPFKRDEWKLEEEPGLFKIGSANGTKSQFNTMGWYKKNQWKKKTYN
jgi:hypothetical protein